MFNFFKTNFKKYLRSKGYFIFKSNNCINAFAEDYNFPNQRASYISYVPDKYSDNLEIYKNNYPEFYSQRDIHKFTNDNVSNNAGDLPRFYFLNLVIDQLLEENIAGDIAEIGVYKGNSAFLLAKFARLSNKTAFLFDTYKGFNENDVSNSNGSNINYEEFKDTSLEHVKKFVGETNTVFIEGYFPESLNGTDIAEKQFCLVHIDCDLEKPVVSSLEYFYPKLSSGGFIIMHDYSSLYWSGARKGIQEFFSDKKEKIIPIPDKSGTAVIRKV
jgi:hypothetical protein